MKELVVRSDGMVLNLTAVLFFTPRAKDMIVEMPGNDFYLIKSFTFFDLTAYDQPFHREFEGWPKT